METEQGEAELHTQSTLFVYRNLTYSTLAFFNRDEESARKTSVAYSAATVNRSANSYMNRSHLPMLMKYCFVTEADRRS